MANTIIGGGGISIEIINAEKVAERMRAISREVSKLGKVMGEISLFVEGEVKQSIAGRRAEKASVDTGRFLNSVKSSNTKDTAKIESNLKYAQYLEYGTSRIKPRRHFRNSLDRNKKKITKFIDMKIGEDIRKVFR